MNHMEQVANMLGVELNEEFDVCFDNNNVYMKAQFTENGFRVNGTNMVAITPYSSIQVFEWILCGLATINRKPWRPKREEVFWHINPVGDPILDKYDGITSYLLNFYKIGNCYRTCEQAEANRDKWVAFYASDEVLEV